MNQEIRQFHRLCKDAALFSQVTLVSTFWDEGIRRIDQEYFDQSLQENYWQDFINNGARTDKLEPKPSNNPFERNPISPEDARKVLLDAMNQKQEIRNKLEPNPSDNPLERNSNSPEDARKVLLYESENGMVEEVDTRKWEAPEMTLMKTIAESNGAYPT
jgi:hypothetical protein